MISQSRMMRRLVSCGLFAVLLFACFFRLDSVPPVWWDEGWTLSVARNWVELGHYGRLLGGKPALRGLEAGFPVTASIALGFRVFGIGIFQARLVAVMFTLAAFALLYQVTRRFYNRSIGVATLLVLIFMNGQVDINPLVVGRQVLGEIPALVFLLAGYLCFILAEERLFLFMPATICLWSLALFAKVQAQPFWAAALLLALGLALLRRQWKSAKMFGAAFVGSLALYLCGQALFLRIVPSSTVSGLTQIVAAVLSMRVRLIVLAETLAFGIPTLLGLCWGLWSFLKSKDEIRTHTDLVHFSFLVLAGSWFTWYVMLSVGWPRYMFPPAFLGSVFVAAMIDHWTNHFNLAYTVEQAASGPKKLRWHRQNLSALAATVLIAMCLGQTLAILCRAYVIEPDSSIKDTLHFLNTLTPRKALVETYESELFFLLDRRYHYPPDQIHVDLNRRNSFGERVKIHYDPLAANPDYLVIGAQSKFWDFYDPYLKSGGAFRLLRTYSRYEIFERVR
ncbi:MAG: ArnT family glycosyltransferase [Nitrospirota bacterium]